MTALRVGQVMMWDGRLWVNAEIGEAGTVYDARQYGMLPSATAAVNVASLNEAITAANAAGGGRVLIPDGEYECGSGDILLKSNIMLDFAPGAILNEPHITATGTVGSEIPFTSPALRGASSIALATSSLANGDWLRIASIVHAFSADAGVWQLGHQEEFANYLAEFVRVADASDPAEAVLVNSTAFPYSNTPGGDSDAGFANQCSVAMKVTFIENVRLKGLRTRGKQASALVGVVHLTYCRDVVLEDCELIADENESTVLARMTQCLDCHIRGSRVSGRRRDIPATSGATPVLFETCQGCTLNDVTIEGGFQGLDISWGGTGAVNRGGPSIACGAVNCRSYGASSDGFTTHDGNYANFFRGCTVFGSHFGVRIRSRADEIANCTIIGGGDDSGDVGIYVYQGAAVDCDVHDNVVQGTHRGMVFDLQTALFSSEYIALIDLIGNNAHFHDNKLYDCASHSVDIAEVDTTNKIVGPRLINTEIHRPSLYGVYVRSYANGTVIRGLFVHGLTGTNYGIRYEANIKRLHIDDVHCYGGAAGAVPIVGPSTSTFLTDATTFPAGEAEAFLHIGAVYSDASTKSSSVIRDADAFLRPHWPGLSNRTYVDVFANTSGTWSKRLGALWVRVFMVGEGGPGGSGSKYGAGVQCGGGGGGGGASIIDHTLSADACGNTETVSATATGKGGASVTANTTDGNAGSGQSSVHFGSLLTAGNGAAGQGGTNAAGGTAGSDSSGNPPGEEGGNGGFGAAGSSAATALNSGTSGGGGGGGISAADAAFDGGAGGASRIMGTTDGASGGKAAGTVAGTDGVSLGADGWAPGGGGGGGASSVSGNAGKGGAGGGYGAGGGGGGAARDSVGDSGAGGAGGAPLCVVITYCE
jgi:hypothetical protein